MNFVKKVLKFIWDFALFLFQGTAPRRSAVSSQTRSKIQQSWASNVVSALKTKDPSQLRQALITADKLLDNLMKELVQGEKMSERLKNSQDLMEWELYDRIWKAHKVRNSLVHDIDFEPPHYLLVEAIEDLGEGINSLGVSV